VFDGIAGCRIKIKRAEQHVIDFEAESHGFIHGNPPPFRAVFKGDMKSRKFAWHAASVRLVPDVLPAIAADAIHNLRAALNILWGWLTYCGSCWETDQRNVRDFPFSPNAFEACLKRKETGRTKAAVEILQGFNRSKHRRERLWRMAMSDNADKHHLLVAVAAANRTVVIVGKSAGMNAVRITSRPDLLYPIKKGTELASFESATRTQAEVNMHPQFPALIAFGEPAYFVGEPVIEVLSELLDLVQGLSETLIKIA
jgi:hypothetical protein